LLHTLQTLIWSDWYHIYIKGTQFPFMQLKSLWRN